MHKTPTDPLIKEITDFVNETLKECSGTEPLKLVEVYDVSYTTDDPGNEMLYMALVATTSDNPQDIAFINTTKMKDLVEEKSQLAAGDHAVIVGPVISLNSSLLIPFTFLS